MSERKNHGCMCTWIVNSESGLSDDRTLDPCGLHAAWARSLEPKRIDLEGKLDRWPPKNEHDTLDPKSMTGAQSIDF